MKDAWKFVPVCSPTAELFISLLSNTAACLALWACTSPRQLPFQEGQNRHDMHFFWANFPFISPVKQLQNTKKKTECMCSCLVWEPCQCRAQVSPVTSCRPHRQPAGSETETRKEEERQPDTFSHFFQIITGSDCQLSCSSAELAGSRRQMLKGSHKNQIDLFTDVHLNVALSKWVLIFPSP